MSGDAPEVDSLRERAVKRLRKKRDFQVHLVIYAMINTLLIAVWAVTDSGFFWPIFVIVGWGVGVVANAWDAYGRDEPSEAQIEREMRRIGGRR